MRSGMAYPALFDFTEFRKPPVIIYCKNGITKHRLACETAFCFYCFDGIPDLRAHEVYFLCKSTGLQEKIIYRGLFQEFFEPYTACFIDAFLFNIIRKD